MAKRKRHAEKVEWVESTAQTYRSQRRFDLIFMTGHAFQTLLTDADALAALRNMRAHIKDRGRIVFETRNPNLDWVGEWDARSRLVRMLPSGEAVESLEITGRYGEVISFQTSYTLPQGRLITCRTLRFPSREQGERLIARSGLVVRDLFGDWHGGAFEADFSREMIFVAEVAE